ncbi:outer membrane protein assembly factor BamE [Ectothiorhodospiraceae bacterium 2226]|nr:outer membrane protein assembly factor BamE [Ectothiorhodospiraceae bacterium 2226]
MPAPMLTNSPQMQKLLIYGLLVLLPLMAACTPHRLEVPQGNIVTAEMVEQLRPGMDEQQVLYIMGSPLLVDPFRGSRWDYPSYVLTRGERQKQAHVVLYFEQGRLARIEERIAPERPPERPPEHP